MSAIVSDLLAIVAAIKRVEALVEEWAADSLSTAPGRAAEIRCADALRQALNGDTNE